jgi:hypothetical protein
VPYKSTRIHFHHFTSSPLALEEKTPKTCKTRENNPSRRAALHQRSVPFESEFSVNQFLSLICNLMVYPSLLFPILTCFLKRSLGLKSFPSTSYPTPPLKKRMPRRNRG